MDEERQRQLSRLADVRTGVDRKRTFCSLLAIGCALLGVAPVAAQPDTATTAASGCRQYREAQPVAANRTVQVYRHQRSYLVACVGLKGKPLTLNAYGAWTRVVLAGRFITYRAENDCAAQDCSAQIGVTDTRTRKTRYADFPSYGFRLTGLVLNERGAAAFIYGFPRFGAPWVVAKLEATGVSRLDAGTDVDPKSLALADATIYWSRAGTARSAPLQ